MHESLREESLAFLHLPLFGRRGILALTDGDFFTSG
jgi:hypothetical protein